MAEDHRNILTLTVQDFKIRFCWNTRKKLCNTSMPDI